VDLDEASLTAVSWAARHVLRNGASSMVYCSLCDSADAGSAPRCWRAQRWALGRCFWAQPERKAGPRADICCVPDGGYARGVFRALTPPVRLEGDTALLLHVIPATYPSLEPALGLGGEGVFTSVPDPEAEQLRVRFVVAREFAAPPHP